MPEKGRGWKKSRGFYVCLFFSNGSIFLMEENSILMAGYEFVPVSHKAHPPGICVKGVKKEVYGGSQPAVWL